MDDDVLDPAFALSGLKGTAMPSKSSLFPSSPSLSPFIDETRSAELWILYKAGESLVVEEVTTVALEPKVREPATGRRRTAMKERNSPIVEYYLVDAAPRVTIEETPIAFAAKTADRIIFGWVDEIDSIAPDADEFDRAIVTGFLADMRQDIERRGARWVYQHVQDQVSTTIRAREVIKCAPPGMTEETLLQQLRGRLLRS